ncbi:MAG: GNAT family N-acetyltransferase [Caldilineaceae bacterium]
MLAQLQQGYAQMLDVSVERMRTPGLHVVVTPRRDQPEWANWVHPVWFFKLEETVVCSVSPVYATKAKAVLAAVKLASLLDTDLLTVMQQITAQQSTRGQSTTEQSATAVHPAEMEWVQCELLYYPYASPPQLSSQHVVENLQPTDDNVRGLLRLFDGGVYGIRAEDGTIAAHGCIKDKGLVHEIAVGTEVAYRQRGMGKAVVAAAVAQILERGKVPVYWPDSLQNLASYRLAYALGFQKAAEMLFCCYALPDWAGFPLA